MSEAKGKITQLINEEAIILLVNDLAALIAADYAGITNQLTIVCVTKGSVTFTTDLVRRIHAHKPELSLRIEYVRASSYGARTESSGKVEMKLADLTDLTGKHVLVVEDIVDTGRTASHLLSHLREQFQMASLKIVSLLDKPSRRVVDFKPDYVGLTIDDLFVVGYGLDFNEQYRELPFIGVLS